MRKKFSARRKLSFSIFISSILVAASHASAQGLNECLGENPQLRIRACTQIIQSNSHTGSDLGILYFARGTAEDTLGQLDQAVSDYTKALSLAPPSDISAKIFSKRGLIYYKTKQTGKAISDFNDQLRLEPNAQDAYIMRGVSYKDAKDYPHAIADLSDAIRLNPNGKLTYLAHFHRGMIYGFESEYATSLKDLSRAIELQPDHPDSYDLRGIANFKLRNYEAAISDLTVAIKLKPNDPSPYESRAKAYEAMGKTSLAVADYRKAKELGRRGQ